MTQQVHNTVFISYRRSTSSYLARAIYMDLKAHGYDVFMDVQSIDSGQFDAIILRQIEARAHFLILCTPGTFDRINDPGDWLRREIEHALLHQRNIVPIMTSDFKFDASTTQRFAGQLAELPRYNGVNVPADFFEEAMSRVRTRFLRSAVGVSLADAPVSDKEVIEAKQAEIESQPIPTVIELSAEDYYNRGVARMESDHGGKFADYSTAIRLNPQYVDAYIARAEVRLEKSDYQGAIADYGEAIRLKPQLLEAYTRRGDVRYHISDYDGAIADYSEVIRLNPQDYFAYYNRGAAYDRKQQYRHSIADYNAAIELNPRFENAYNVRGNSRKLFGDIEGAIADYNEALRLNPEYAIAYYNRGLAWKEVENYANALNDFNLYIALTKTNPDSRTVFRAQNRIREIKEKLGLI